MMYCIALAALLLASPLAGMAAATQPAVPARVMIVSIDGLRPDLALRARMPHLRGLMALGSYSFWAITTDVAITLPSHASMLTGVPPEKHRITFNSDPPGPEPRYPAVPTIFELASKQGHTTAAVAGKSKFRVFDKPGTLNWKFFKEATDDQVASTAVAIVREHRPEVLFVHLPDCDRAGHQFGWGSDQQIAAIENADRALGEILNALDDQHVLDETLIIVTADHGGAGRNHGIGNARFAGANDPRSLRIPWIAAGPGVKANYDLTLDVQLKIHTEDTFATACEAMGLPLPHDITGKPILEIFQKKELLNAAP